MDGQSLLPLEGSCACEAGATSWLLVHQPVGWRVSWVCQDLMEALPKSHPAQASEDVVQHSIDERQSGDGPGLSSPDGG